MKQLFIIVLLCLITGNAIRGQQKEYPTSRFYTEAGSEPRERVVDFERMRLEVSFDAPKGLVKGKVTHYFSPLRKQVSEIYFDAVGIRIQQALLNGKSVEYVNNGKGITVYPKPALAWNTNDSITFVYEANPREGVYFVGWNDPKNIMRKQIWTQGEDISHRHWIPMYDEPNDKMITETIITFDKNYRVISNGKKISEKENKDGTRTWFYAITKPHSSYLLMLAIGNYEVKNVKSKSGVPIQLWYYPDQADRVEPTYRRTADALDFLEKEIGVPYPWTNLANIPASDFVTGAMENTTAILFGDFWYIDERGFLDDIYIDTDIHEQAHQWFGDLTTMRSWKGLWLNESFATYYGKMGCKKFFGEEFYQWNRREEHEKSLRASESDRLPLVHTEAGGTRYYPKGSAVIEMMNYVYGEDAYKRVIYHFLSHHRYRNVETNDLYQSFMDTLGVTPDWFFDQWIYRGGEPHYLVNYFDVKEDHRRTEIMINQIHAMDELTKVFKMPIVFEVHYTDGTKDSVREWIDQAVQKTVIPNRDNKTIDFVLFDPGDWILKNVTFEKTLNELKAQALRASNMIDRYDAVVGMRSHPAADKRDALLELFARETFHAIKSEIIAQLIYDFDKKSITLIRAGLNDPSVEVRKAVLDNMKLIPASLKTEFEVLLTDSSYNIVNTALTKLTDQFPQDIDRYLELTKNQFGLANEIKFNWLEIKAKRGDKEALQSIVEYTSNSYPASWRRQAFRILKRFNYMDDTVLANMFDALLYSAGFLSPSVRPVADYYYEQYEFKNKIKAYYDSHAWEPWQKDILRKVVR
ncbi:M1 family metallopeptidase [bacterium]|nr:MAG: M1 family metallopeptidase [bacterium]